jgi:hypothetical protein
VVAGTSAGVFLTTDNGGTWTPRNTGITNLGINTIAVSGPALYAAGNGVYLSTNNGTSWTPISSGITSPTINSITILGTDLFVGTQNGVFRSTNNGGGWSAVNNGLTTSQVYCLATVGSNIVAGTTAGLYLTTNSGANWSRVNTGLPEFFGLIFPSILSLAVAPNSAGGTDLFAGTFLMGVWRRPASEVTDVRSKASPVPENFSLEPNYPNPFNPVTVIQFSIPAGTHTRVSLRVYDLLGREVAVLVDESKEPGRYEVRFDGSNLSSGVYFCRLTADQYVQTRKMSLLR